MKDEYLGKVDKEVMKAFDEGAIVIGEELWEDYAIRHRLLLYGEIKDGYYTLNELGIRYVMEGCSNGLKEKIKRQAKIERLDIETKSFTRNKQKKIYRITVASFVISILAFFGGYKVLLDLLSWLLDLVQLLCSLVQR